MAIQRTISVFILLGLVNFVPLASTGLAQDDTYDVEVTWSVPTEGTQPVLYHVWVRSKVDGDEKFGDWEDWGTSVEPMKILTYKKGYCYEVKVRAEDKDGLIGPFSDTSVEYCGVVIEVGSSPGQPGQPTLVK